ncbi:hypothetical protein SDC9_204166 [bioreactor metagenome]|uniref:Uncharacterized protein n=1 Tax=bioreactor metagenome TaxID=1076179 RepID=A0A645IZ46_9ZZZZ
MDDDAAVFIQAECGDAADLDAGEHHRHAGRHAVGTGCGQLQVEGFFEEAACVQQIDDENRGQHQRCGGKQPDLEMQFVHA